MKPTNQIMDFREWMKDLETRISSIDEAMAAITNGMTIPKQQALFSCLIHLSSTDHRGSFIIRSD
jgi:hypothetical protein